MCQVINEPVKCSKCRSRNAALTVNTGLPRLVCLSCGHRQEVPETASADWIDWSETIRWIKLNIPNETVEF